MAKKVMFELEVPENLFTQELSQEAFTRELEIDAALKLFQKSLVSSGYAAKMLGMTKRDFLELLRKRGIPLVDLSDEQLTEEVDSIGEMEEHLRGEQEKNV